jgi:phenylacetate-CoA ligase
MTLDLAARSPLLSRESLITLNRLREHEDAPRWNHAAGDRLVQDDLDALDRFRGELASARSAERAGPPAERIIRRIAALRERVPSFRKRLHEVTDIVASWERIPTMSREDIAVSVSELVPDDADLERLIVYRTAGTTGHALLVPHDVRAAACYQPLIERALSHYGVPAAFDSSTVACFLVGAQARTVTYPTVLSAWGGAGFAKLNLHRSDWPNERSAQRYFREMSPRLLTGDPISFSEMLRQEVAVRPTALISTAVAMTAALRNKLSSAFGCPVIDWYSLTETGPIGYLCPRGGAFHILAHDLYVETVRPDGTQSEAGERGEIAVTGGRNPFLPLLRYRTGDYGSLDYSPCTCGDPTPRICELEGRAPVLFRARDGQIVNPVDLSRILREFPLVQHELKQHADLGCELVARTIVGSDVEAGTLVEALRVVLGHLPIDVRFDPELGERNGGKVVPYQSAQLLEE